MALVLCAYLVLLGRLAYWQVWRHADMARLAATYHDDTITLPAVRGNILDRNGALLVTNTPVFSIFASPDQISARERQDIAGKLATLLELTPDAIQAKLATTRKFVYLARRVPASVAQQLDKLRLPGIGKVAETQRSYVDGGVAGTTLAANLLGFANDAGVGNYGVEGYYDKLLHGQDGFEATVKDLGNQPIVLSDRQRRGPGVPGGERLAHHHGADHRPDRRLGRCTQLQRQPVCDDADLAIHRPDRLQPVRAWLGHEGRDPGRRARRPRHHARHALQRDWRRRRRWGGHSQLGQPGARERHHDAGPGELAQRRRHQGAAARGGGALLSIPAEVRHRLTHRGRRRGRDVGSAP